MSRSTALHHEIEFGDWDQPRAEARRLLTFHGWYRVRMSHGPMSLHRVSRSSRDFDLSG
jgi:hypothetical protein